MCLPPLINTPAPNFSVNFKSRRYSQRTRPHRPPSTGGVNLWVGGSVKPFHNEVRVMPAVCLVLVCVVCVVCVSQTPRERFITCLSRLAGLKQPRGFCRLQQLARSRDDSSNLKVVAVMMSSCDCQHTPTTPQQTTPEGASHPTPLAVPATGGDTERGDGCSSTPN